MAYGSGERVEGEDAPQGARIRRADGSAIECDLARYPDGDWRGGATWKAVARESIQLDYDGDRFECDTVPPGAVISFGVELLPGGDGYGSAAATERVTKVEYEADFACPEGGTGLTWPTRPTDAASRRTAGRIAAALERVAIASREERDGKVIEVYASAIAPIA